MKFEYQPPYRVGNLIGGMVRTLVRQLLNSEYIEFRKTPGAGNTTNAFDKLELHAYCDSDNKLKGVEIFKPSQVSIRGIELLNFDLRIVIEQLNKIGVLGTEDSLDWVSSDETLKLYCPDYYEEEN